MKLSLSCAVGVLALASVALAKDAAQGAKSETVSASDVKFGPAPPSIPAGAELAVLHGDPGKKGPYVMRLRLPDGYRLPPHWHSQQEHLTVLEGTFNLGMGDKVDDGSAKALSAGGFHYIAARQPHYAFSKGVTVLQVHGMGPFDIHYLDPKDDPRHGAAATK